MCFLATRTRVCRNHDAVANADWPASVACAREPRLFIAVCFFSSGSLLKKLFSVRRVVCGGSGDLFFLFCCLALSRSLFPSLVLARHRGKTEGTPVCFFLFFFLFFPFSLSFFLFFPLFPFLSSLSVLSFFSFPVFPFPCLPKKKKKLPADFFFPRQKKLENVRRGCCPPCD